MRSHFPWVVLVVVLVVFISSSVWVFGRSVDLVGALLFALSPVPGRTSSFVVDGVGEDSRCHRGLLAEAELREDPHEAREQEHSEGDCGRQQPTPHLRAVIVGRRKRRGDGEGESGREFDDHQAAEKAATKAKEAADAEAAEKAKVVAKAAVGPKQVKAKVPKALPVAPPPPPPQVIQRGNGKRGVKRPRSMEDQ